MTTTYLTGPALDVVREMPTASVDLDPFAGTFTTGHAAEIHGRDAIGIDLDETNRDLVDRRRTEVRRALLDVPPEVPGQLTLEALL